MKKNTVKQEQGLKEVELVRVRRILLIVGDKLPDPRIKDFFDGPVTEEYLDNFLEDISSEGIECKVYTKKKDAWEDFVRNEKKGELLQQAIEFHLLTRNIFVK